MEMIYTNADREDIGMLSKLANIDFEVGTILSDSSNDFQITMPADVWDSSFDYKSIIYENTKDSEVGGMILGKTSNTATNKIILHGVNWRGLIATKIIVPPSGTTHYQARGDANAFIKDILKDQFDGLIVGSDELCGITVYRDLRYINMLQGIEKTLADSNLKIKISFDIENVKAVVSAVPIEVFEDIEYSQDYGFNLIAKDVRNGYNHCVCLGKGELLDRMIVDLYKLSDGTIVSDKTTALNDGIFGLNERTIIYENTNAEDENDLIDGGTDKLEENSNELSMEISNVDDVEVGDIVGARDRITGIQMRKKISSKLYKGYMDRVKIDYKVGE